MFFNPFSLPLCPDHRGRFFSERALDHLLIQLGARQ
jgi:hypothetical protein